MGKRYRSEAFAAIIETMAAIHEIGVVDKKTMREFDEACLTPVRVLSPVGRLGVLGRTQELIYTVSGRCNGSKRFRGLVLTSPIVKREPQNVEQGISNVEV